MANTKSAAKRARQAVRLSQNNASVLSALKTAQKKVRTAIAGGNADEARAEAKSFSSALDKAAKRGIIHKNSAARRKGVVAGALAKK